MASHPHPLNPAVSTLLNLSFSFPSGSFELTDGENEELILVEGAIIVAVKKRLRLFEKISPRLTPRRDNSSSALGSVDFKGAVTSKNREKKWNWKECYLRMSCNRLYLHEFIGDSGTYKPKPRHTFKLSNITKAVVQEGGTQDAIVERRLFQKEEGDAASGASNISEKVESEFCGVELSIQMKGSGFHRVLLGFVMFGEARLTVNDGQSSIQGSPLLAKFFDIVRTEMERAAKVRDEFRRRMDINWAGTK